MLRWRALVFVLLLILGLPVLSGARAETHCGVVSPAVTEALSGGVVHGSATLQACAERQRRVAIPGRACDDRCDATMNHSHPAGQCSSCALCYCAGALAPASIAVVPSHSLLVLHACPPASDAATPFLTDGIERPPRFLFA